MRFVLRAAVDMHPKEMVFTAGGPARLVRCEVCNSEDERQEYLRRLCGLEGAELEASFEDYWSDKHGDKALQAAQSFFPHKTGCGWLTVAGPYGTGKTYLLMAIVNKARQRGVIALYATMSNLLEHLRRAYKPGAEVDFDTLWKNVLQCRVLCLDEAEKWNPTPWAEEKFSGMMDERYRNWRETITVLAANSLDDMPSYLKSRAMDGRFKLVFLSGSDVRPKLKED